MKNSKERVQENNREEAAAKIKKGLTDAFKKAQQSLKEFEEACGFCRMFHNSWVRKYLGTIYVYGDYGLDRKGDRVSCPKCKRLIWSDDHRAN